MNSKKTGRKSYRELKRERVCKNRKNNHFQKEKIIILVKKI